MSAALKFRGAAVYFMSYGVPPLDGDIYQVTTHGRSEVQNLRVCTNDARVQFVGYWRTGLDPSKEHTITISDLAGTALNVDAFM